MLYGNIHIYYYVPSPLFMVGGRQENKISGLCTWTNKFNKDFKTITTITTLLTNITPKKLVRIISNS